MSKPVPVGMPSAGEPARYANNLAPATLTDLKGTHSATAKRWSAIAVLVTLVATTLTACLPLGSSARTTVGPNGFNAEIAGVTVTAPAGVAPEGTKVELEAIDAPVPDDVASFATVEGAGVSISFDGGTVQPELPFQVRFELPRNTEPEDVFVIGNDQSAGSGVSFVDSAWDAEQSVVVATVDHLSWFAPVRVDEDKFSQKIAAWIDQSLGRETSRPACFGDEGDLSFSVVDGDVAWPCADAVVGGVKWSLYSNSGLVWKVRTDPKADYEPLTSLSVAGIATIVAVNRLGPNFGGDAALVPLETLKGTFDNHGPYTIALQVDPGLSQVATFVYALGMIFPSKWLDVALKGECLVGVIKTAASNPSGESLRSIMSCVGEFLAGSGGKLIGLLLTGPGLLASQLEGLVREIARTNTVQFTLSQRDASQTAVLPNGGVWLHDLPQEVVPQESEAVAAIVPIDDRVVIFENSSSVWVGCGGGTHRITFDLAGKYSELSFALGLQDFVPEGMTVLFRLRTLGIDQTWSLPRGTSWSDRRSRSQEQTR